MKKVCFLILFVLFLTIPVFSQEIKLKDVSDDHWASKAVYDLIRAGVTKGFPDGTFRGDQKLSRYEAAVLISKMAELAGLTEGFDIPTIYKAQAELKAEIDSIKAKMKKTEGFLAGVSGEYSTEYRTGNFMSSGLGRSPAVNYRLQTTFAGKLADSAGVKVNLDTMDAGYEGGQEGVASQLLEVEGKLKSDIGNRPLEVRVRSGPGPRVKGTDAQFPVRSGKVYPRSRSGIEILTRLGQTDLGASYTARSTNTGSPAINVSHFKGYFSTGVGKVPYLGEVEIAGSGDVLLKGLSASNANIRAQLGLEIEPVEGIEMAGKIGLGDLQNITSLDKLALEGRLRLKDYFKTGTDISITGLRVGSNYLPDSSFDAADMLGLNVFNKYYQSGFLNLDSKITQKLNENVEISGKGNLILSGLTGYGTSYAGTSMTLSGGVLYRFAPQASMDISYTILNDPAAATTTSDLATLGLNYKF